MQHTETSILKDGRTLILRNGSPADAAIALDIFQQTHAETDNLLTYPEENSFTVADEAEFLRETEENEQMMELLAFVDGKLVGSAGICPVGRKTKIRHRGEFGISILREFWGLGIGRHLTQACIECAKKAGFLQLELDVIRENAPAIALYTSVGFTEYGSNPRGFRTRDGEFQELVHMRLELDK